MKKVLFFLGLALTFVACNGEHEQALSQRQIDSLFVQSVPLAPEDSLQLAPSLSAAPAVTVTEEAHQVQILHVRLPEVTGGEPVQKLTIEATLQGDTIVSYRITTSASKQPAAPRPKPRAESPGVIRPKDTKTSIARRLGVSPQDIKNHEPLQVGEKIKL